MVRRSFISLYFLGSRLQILKLSGSKKKVEKFATVDLPEGVIQNHEVKDPNILAGILKKVWEKYGIREKSVGIIIPEFSTFTKSLNLPDLPDEELDEAVRWQSLDYIPLNQNEMVLDWKIIKKLDTSVQVLAVAIKDKILKGYVDAAALAGLYPLVVETPSISLIRASGDDVGRIIIYFSFDEVVVVLADGKNVVSSAVLDVSSSPSEIIKTAQRMISHYQEVEVKKVYLGGVISSQEVVNQVVGGLNIEASKIGIKQVSFNETELQKYLIPISMQFKNPVEPSSSETINLLPEAIVKSYEKKRLNRQLWGLTVISTLILSVCLLALGGMYVYVLQNYKTHQNENQSQVATYGKNKEALEQIKTINLTSEKVHKIYQLMLYPEDVFELIDTASFEEIRIINYNIDFEKKTARLQGVASTRESLLEFKTNLEKQPEISQVSLPLSSFEKEADLEFNISFSFFAAEEKSNNI